MGGSNQLFTQVMNPPGAILKPKYKWLNPQLLFDPIGYTATQGVTNIWNVIDGKENFGEHKDWWGLGENNWANGTMRKWTEGAKYKQWDKYEADQAAQYETTAAKYKQKEEPILNTSQKPDHITYENKRTRTTTSVSDESLLSSSLNSDVY